jgi:hypothetical protein
MTKKKNEEQMMKRKVHLTVLPSTGESVLNHVSCVSVWQWA